MPFEKKDPLSPLNRRISIIVMNRDAEDRFYQAAEAEAGIQDDLDIETEGADAVSSAPAVSLNAPLPSRPELPGR
jgi:chemotaxis protein MotB